jgi:Ca2+-binding EF-hand superfamily protein
LIVTPVPTAKITNSRVNIVFTWELGRGVRRSFIAELFCILKVVVGIASRDPSMRSLTRMKIKLLSAMAVLSVCGFAAFSQMETASAASASLTALDPDNDGTVDVPEAKAAAAKLFVKLDADKDGTLDAKELSGRVDEAVLKAADPDNDGTLDQKEYDALVEQRLKAADPDNDGTLDDKELSTDAGKSFLLLVQ